MAITVSDISNLLGRFGNERITEQVDQNAPFLNMLDKMPVQGQACIVNIKSGYGSAGWIADQGNLPTGLDVTPEQLTVLPKFFIMRVAIPRGATRVGTGKADGINIVFQELDSAAASSARQVARGLIKPQLETLDAGQVTELGSDQTTFTSADYTGYRVGSYIAAYDATSTTGTPVLNEIIKVVGVDIDADGVGHTITVERNAQSDLGVSATGYLSLDANSNDLAAGDTFWALGSYNNAPGNLSAFSDATSSVQGKAAGGEWKGNTAAASGGVLTVDALRNVFTATAVKSGKAPDFLLMNSRNRQRYSDLLLAQRRYTSGRMDATGGVEIDFEGKPVKIDENVPDTDVYFLRKDCVKHAVWFDFTDEQDGAGGGTSTSGHALVSQSKFEYDHQRSAGRNLVTHQRNGLGSLTGITS